MFREIVFPGNLPELRVVTQLVSTNCDSQSLLAHSTRESFVQCLVDFFLAKSSVCLFYNLYRTSAVATSKEKPPN